MLVPMCLAFLGMVETRQREVAGAFERTVFGETKAEVRSGAAKVIVGPSLPETYGLSQNYPNPFNAVTEIVYQVPEAGRVRLTIYDLLGRKVRALVDDVVRAGYHSVRWDGRDDSGNEVASGTYLYKLEAKDFNDTKRMTLMR